MKKIIGLTGPSGAGKSTAAKAFLSCGAHVLDGDIVARRVVEKGMPALSELTDAFGADVLLPNGELDRKKMAEIAFSTPENLHKLNSITHKYIIAEIKQEIKDSAKTVFVIDAAALFESGLDGICDATVAVTANKESRLARIMARDKLSAHEAEARISAQPKDDFYVLKSRYHIENDGDAAALSRFVSCILKEVECE